MHINFGSEVTITHNIVWSWISMNWEQSEHNFLAQVELIISGYFDLDSNITYSFSDQTSVQDSTCFHLPRIVRY